MWFNPALSRQGPSGQIILKQWVWSQRTHEINTSQPYKTTSNFMFKPKNLNWETHTRNNNNNSNLYTKIYSPWIDPHFGRNITLPYTKDVKKPTTRFVWRVDSRFVDSIPLPSRRPLASTGPWRKSPPGRKHQKRARDSYFRSKMDLKILKGSPKRKIKTPEFSRCIFK